jgi:hypothetical protein
MGAEVGEHPCNVVVSRHSRESGNPVLVPPRHARPFKNALGSRFRGNHGEDDFLVSLGAMKFKLQSDLRNSLSRLWGEG